MQQHFQAVPFVLLALSVISVSSTVVHCIMIAIGIVLLLLLLLLL